MPALGWNDLFPEVVAAQPERWDQDGAAYRAFFAGVVADQARWELAIFGSQGGVPAPLKWWYQYQAEGAPTADDVAGFPVPAHPAPLIRH